MSQCYWTFRCQLSWSSRNPFVLVYCLLDVRLLVLILELVWSFRKTQICGNGLLVKSNHQRLLIPILYVISRITLPLSLPISPIASILNDFCPNRYLLLLSQRSRITWASTLPLRPDQHLVNHGLEVGMTRGAWMDLSMETSDVVLERTVANLCPKWDLCVFFLVYDACVNKVNHGSNCSGIGLLLDLC